LQENNFNLKQEIKKLGMTQKEFSVFVEIHVNTVSRWVRGDLEIPKWVKLLIKYYKKSKILEELSINIKSI